MTFKDIEHLLAERLGFDTQTVGPRAVEAVLRQSMEKAGFSDPAAYARNLATDQEAWNALVDRVVIPETWFFRDGAPFELVGGLARAHMRSRSDKVLRILSCPCSTGEEPYSLAMAMLDAGAPPGSFLVDAADVSRGALETAKGALFRNRSFRNDAPLCRESYFDFIEADGSWRIKPSVASLVRFRPDNLISPDFLKDHAPYDVVFCRNLLIYLHSEARVLAIAALWRLVAEGGVLVLGHAEAIFARENGFKPVGPAAAFAFVKSGTSDTRKPHSARQQNLPQSVSVRRPSVATGEAPATLAAPAISVAPPAEADLSELITARRLADVGELDDALRVCGEYLQRVPDSAEGHFLLGVLYDALGHFDLAASYFRKVLYLDPAHREAMLHLALKQEALGDGSGAALLRARAQRAQDADRESKA